ncbi:MFS transporter [Methylobacterium oryzisoli]|uniref:MFS transporter n=1 Tax=Methylobacterium oryzisoli TaxID=3385502 RepID=UPI003892B1F1
MSQAIATGGVPPASRRPFGQNYAFVVVGVVFLALLAAAGLRAAPGVLILPLEQAFGWSRGTTSFAAGLGIFLYGMVGPFAAALMQSFGIRRTLLCALALMSGATALSALMSEPWHLVATWGVLSGLGSGCVAIVLGATVVNRWFVVRRGLIMGLLTASTATGTLVFLPGLAAIAAAGGWQPVVLTVSVAVAALIPLVWWLLPERPGDIGLVPYGAAPGSAVEPPRRVNPFRSAIDGLVRASRRADFWLLFGTFFICGLTTNGLVGTHLISFCADQGLPEVRAAALLAMMGVFDLIGTTGSGWLTDRYDPRKLLFMYYGLRGLSLMALPFTDFSFYSLSIFAVFYGLDWIATVPPTVRLTNEIFGERDAPIVFGWIAAGHQAGAATAAFGAGLSRAAEGRYLEAFLAAGLTGLIAAVMSLMIARAARRPVAA